MYNVNVVLFPFLLYSNLMHDVSWFYVFSLFVDDDVNDVISLLLLL